MNYVRFFLCYIYKKKVFNYQFSRKKPQLKCKNKILDQNGNKKVREAKLLNGETARSVLSQKCHRVYWKTFSNKCTFVYSWSRFIEYRITISQRRKTKAIKLFNMSQCLLCFEGSLICPTTEQIIVDKHKYFLQSGSGDRGGGRAVERTSGWSSSNLLPRSYIFIELHGCETWVWD